MKKLIGLLCISQLLIGGDHYKQSVKIDMVMDEIGKNLISLCALDKDKECKRLIEEHYEQTPEEVAIQIGEGFQQLVARYEANQITFKAFEKESYNFYTRIPIIVDYNYTLRVAFQFPQEDGSTKYRLPEH